MFLLEVRNIVKRYTAVPAVNGVTFSMQPGEVLGVPRPERVGKEHDCAHADWIDYSADEWRSALRRRKHPEQPSFSRADDSMIHFQARSSTIHVPLAHSKCMYHG